MTHFYFFKLSYSSYAMLQVFQVICIPRQFTMTHMTHCVPKG